MAWTTPKTWSAGETLTAANFNLHIRDNELAMGPHLIVRKPTDESLTSDTTLQNDDHLLFSGVGANEVWFCHWALIYDAGTTGDIKLAFTFPSGRVDFSATGTDETGTPTFRRWNTATSPTTAVALIGPGGPMNFNMFGVFANGATPGTLQLQWAQNTTHGTATTMKANSTLWAVKLA
jgi:hypothetical protein